ncbi:PhzF family phenazine biosynthesis protein [Mycobacterium sp. ACS4331]|uniref:PhzF family phenazine biosynthesis protein n=1 Tax=Mycobacterium sp. ACS4331 TaxID=1834121 RepID=UPI0007FC0326|nr:PhzF family phenazine biosynthesis protein [Mycobacterium sp. ACS4331]OBF15687.1 hypothetical protein A5727_14780 [Mycobacterium sp. ACS4331]
MGIDVTVLRVFTDSEGNYGNPLGVVDARTVGPSDRQALATQLGYSETIFVHIPTAGAATAQVQIFTPAAELPFAGHPTVGASWWLKETGTPVHTLQTAAGIVQVNYDVGSDKLTAISARSEWAPEFAIHDLDSVDDLMAADPNDYADDVEHYLWTWTNRDAGEIRSRMFAPHLGIIEDEATGAAAVRITDYLSRDLHITQGQGSRIETTWSPEGWVQVAGAVVNDGIRRVD